MGFIAEIIFDFVLDTVLYGIGYAFMFIVTLGRYPKEDTDEWTIIAVGILVIVAAVLAAYFLNK